MPIVNKFLKTIVAGEFDNIDHPTDNTILANAYFQRDIEVGGNIDISGNIINTNLTNALASKATIEYVDNAVSALVDSSPETLNTLNELANALGDDPNFATTVATNIGLKSDTTYVDDEILNLQNQINNIEENYNPSSDVSFQNLTVSGTITNTALTNLIDTKADKNNTVLTGLSVIPTPSTHTIYCDGQIYFHGGDLANPASRIHIGSNQLMVWDNKINEQIVYRWGPTDSVKQMFHMNGDVTIPGNILNCTTINDINSSLALKADKTYTDNQLNLKANNTDVNSALANKLSNNANSSTSAYLHFALNSQPYTEYLNNTKFGSIGVNKYTNGQAEMNFIQNGFIPGPTYRAFNFLLATSNTTFDELIRINKNGDTTFLGTITSPTINTINANINLKSNLSYVDNQLLLKDDITSVNNKLLLKSDLTYVDDEILNLQNQINNIEGNYNPSSDVTFQNLTVSGTITNTNLTNLINTKADKTYTDTQLTLKADKTYTDTQLALKTDKTYTDSQLVLKTDKTYTDSQLLLKADNNNAVLTGTVNIANSNVGTINCNNQIYFYKTNVATPSSRIHIGTVNAMYWDNVLNEQIIYRWGSTNIAKQILYPNGDISIPGNILNSPTITGINSSIVLKADKTYTDTQLATKLSNNVNSAMGAYLHFTNNSQPYTEYNSQNFGSISVNKFPSGHGSFDFIHNGFGISNLVTNAFNFSIATSNTTFNSLLRITKNGNAFIAGTISSPTITTINSDIALKTDKTYTDTQLANKLSNNENSRMSAYLHFGLNSQPYTEYLNTTKFASISVNKFTNGDAEMNFIQNGFIPGASKRAFNFLLATSNTTFDELIRVNKNGDTTFLGTIASPTIATINTNIALKEDTTAVNTKLANYALLNSSPTFTGNVKSQIYTGGMIRNNSNATITYTSATLPSTIVHDGPIGVYVIPLMPLGTRFSVLRTINGTMNISSSDSTVYFFNKKDSYYFTGTSAESYTNAIEMTEDSRTFVLCEMYRNGNPVKVWLTESSHTYSLMHDMFNATVGVYMLDGGDYGRTNAIHHPILCSNKNYGPANSDDGYILNPGYSITVYTDVNYGGGWYSHSNSYQHTPTKPKHFVATSTNNMQSIKVFYNGKEIIVDGISN